MCLFERLEKCSAVRQIPPRVGGNNLCKSKRKKEDNEKRGKNTILHVISETRMAGQNPAILRVLFFDIANLHVPALLSA